MMSALLGLTAIVPLAAHLGSGVLATLRSQAKPASEPTAFRPFISLLRPVKGLDPNDLETLGSSFKQDYPAYEVIFCAATPDDPACAAVRALIAAHPDVPAQLLIGEAHMSANPKLDNLVKGVEAAKGDWLAMADANLLLGPDYLAGLADSWQADTGLVSGPALGVRADNIWGAVECAFLNTTQARWQLAADAVGLGFAQGKTLFWNRKVLEAGGGMAALDRDMAEDVASTKLVRGQGLRVRLPRKTSTHPVGKRDLKAVWDRQLRWSRIRRDGFPGLFAGEIFQGPALAFASLATLAALGSVPAWFLAAFLVLWYGVEVTFAAAIGLKLSWRDLAAMGLRDLMQPALWVATFARRGFDWRGNDMATAPAQ